MGNEGLARLGDEELTAELRRLATGERNATVCLIAHLAEFDQRQLYLGAGFPSLFAYCREVLRLSEHESYSRIEAARASRRFPAILRWLAEGVLNLTTIRLLAPYLKAGTGDELLEQAKHRSKREVEELIASRFPRPDVAMLIRRAPERVAVVAPGELLRTPTPTVGANVASVAGKAVPIAGVEGQTESALDPAATNAVGPEAALPKAALVVVQGTPRTVRADLIPLASDRYLVRFMAGAKTRDKLRRAQDLLRHAIPDGDLGQVVDRALDLLLDKLLRDKVAVTSPARTRVSKGGLPQGSRHIPVSVRRGVWLRDGGGCAFVSAGGRRCSARSLLEFHHRRPFGIGGEATVENIELRCRAHNLYEARLFYGPPRELIPDGGQASPP